jgi:tetratricopeptide (TPR) repeat protein
MQSSHSLALEEFDVNAVPLALTTTLLAFCAMTIPAGFCYEDFFAKGQTAYQTGDYTRAMQLFDSEVRQNPRNASAHYMLAEAFCKLARKPEAISEFRIALSLAKTGTVADYSRSALSALTNSVPSSPPKSSAAARSDSTGLGHSVSTMSSQTNERESVLQAECDQKVRLIMQDADDQAARVTKEMDERIAANGSVQYSFNRFNHPYVTYDPSSANQEIKAECLGRMEKLKQEARYRADAVIRSYKERQAAWESSTTSLESTYAGGNKIDSNTALVPNGTTVYSRQYQSSDDPSGRPVPVRAAPAQSLSTTKPGN